MIKRLTLAVGFGAGYLMGAKAGTERYYQIMAMVAELRSKALSGPSSATSIDLTDTSGGTPPDLSVPGESTRQEF